MGAIMPAPRYSRDGLLYDLQARATAGWRACRSNDAPNAPFLSIHHNLITVRGISWRQFVSFHRAAGRLKSADEDILHALKVSPSKQMRNAGLASLSWTWSAQDTRTR